MRNKFKGKHYLVVCSIVIILLILITLKFLIYSKSENNDKRQIQTKNEENHVDNYPSSFPPESVTNDTSTLSEQELPTEMDESIPRYYLPYKPENVENWKYINMDNFFEKRIDGNVVSLIGSFYYRLAQKDFDYIYKYGSQGRTLDEISKLYADITYIKGDFITQIDDDTYNVKAVTVSGQNVTFYSVNLDIGWNADPLFGGAYIKNSQSTEYSGEVVLECLDYKKFLDTCFVRDLKTGDPLILDTLGITTYPVLQLARKEGAIQYLATYKGDGGVNWDDIYEYNLDTHKISYIQTLIYAGEHFYNLPNLKFEDCNYHKYEEYLDGGCIYSIESYRDTPEFISDKEQALKYKNYFDELVKYVDRD